ncbi:MAG: tetratricopeptide repeat protein [Acidobacteria bacterium]|nr:tetratricopeptide repeat protein [Acidobacteriota bacterium]
MNLIRIAIWIAAAVLPAAQAQPIAALQLNERGNRAAEAGRYQEAIGLYRRAVDLWKEAGPAYDAHRAGTLLNLGVAEGGVGDRQGATSLMEEALALHRATLGPGHERTVTNMNLLAANYLIVGRIDEAEAMFREALPAARALNPEGAQTARALGGIGNVLLRRGRAREAIKPSEEALRIAIRAGGEDSLDTALAFTGVAQAHLAAGDTTRALPLLRRARSIYERALGGDHPRVAVLLSQEGVILMGDRKFASAEDLLTCAVAALGRSCPKCAAERAIAEDNLALLRMHQGRYGDAGDLLTDVVSLRESFTTPPGTELAGTLNLLARVREKQKRYQDAEKLKQRASTIQAYH